MKKSLQIFVSFEISGEQKSVRNEKTCIHTYVHVWGDREDRRIAVKPAVDLRIRVYQPLGFRLFYICPMIYRPLGD